MDTTIRTLRLETSKRGRPNTPHHHSSAGRSQKDLATPIPKELGLPSLEGGVLDSQAPTGLIGGMDQLTRNGHRISYRCHPLDPPHQSQEGSSFL